MQLFAIKIVGMIKPANEFWIKVLRKKKLKKKKDMYPLRQIVKFMATRLPVVTKNLRIVINTILNLILCSIVFSLVKLLPSPFFWRRGVDVVIMQNSVCK